jgi:beta-mannosidase
MNPGMAHLRKVQSHFGWDWGLSLPISDIWRDIFLEGTTIARFSDTHLYQAHTEKHVDLYADVQHEAWEEGD